MNKVNFFLVRLMGMSLIFGLVSTAFADSYSADSTMEATEHVFAVPQPLVMGIKHRTYGFSAIESSDAELSMNYTQLKLPLGSFDMLGGVFVPTQSIERTAFRFNGTATDNQDSYTLKTQLMLIRQVNDVWTSIIQVTPSLHSDLAVIDEDAFSLMGLAIWRYQSTKKSSWVMGIGVNRLFGVYKPIPLLSYNYKLTKHMQFDLGFPITKAEYRWRDDWSAYTSIAPVGGNWRYESDSSSNSSVEKERLNLSYTSWIGALGMRYRVKNNYWASLEVGQSFNRKLNLDAENSGNNDINIADTAVLMFSFGYHP